MARLPIPGGDEGSWGEVLNTFLAQAHNADGTLKDLTQAQVTNLVADLAAKYVKPAGGIPETHLAQTVQDSLTAADTLAATAVTSSDIYQIVRLTQAQYNVLSPIDPNTLYVIEG